MTPEELFRDGSVDARAANVGGRAHATIDAEDCRRLHDYLRGERLTDAYADAQPWGPKRIRKHLRGECDHDCEAFVFSEAKGWQPEEALRYNDKEFLKRRRREGASTTDIAAECDVAASTIRHWLDAYDLK